MPNSPRSRSPLQPDSPGRTLELAGDEPTPLEAAAAITEAIGIPVRYEQLTHDEAATTPKPTPSASKGLGEIVQVGVTAAVANAVFHIAGRRICQLPITAEALL